MTIQTKKLSDLLLNAEKSKKGVTPLTELKPDLTVVEAYNIQMDNIQVKLENGETISGKKIGLTSLAMQQLLGVNEPDYGHLLQSMEVPNNGVISCQQLLEPKVEGEIAFFLKKDLAGPNVSVGDVLEATEYVMAALEIVDSRIAGWKIKLCDTIADNASSALYVLGDKKIPPHQLDLKEEKMAFYKNEQLINEGIGKAALGDPAYCVAWLANKLSEFGIRLRANEVILSGALSAAANAGDGDEFVAKFQTLGEVKVNFE
ncbi:2-keto-4-pentenoate hydratase [Sutcliffiella horikoshii]|uniref:2-keto-4-pentenoate hydratase n=1 Tax=Sutcliffiella horikoshii TaxID=79883 RepID=A0A5D4SZ05_9BACI|nr:fumarylacetoacetate hydrolase family protein [Sutcliffiella horikoshii]TYS68199.1 2-keto-4-pentenoate hydratase [Sutcliffiella horikoshii]